MSTIPIGSLLFGGFGDSAMQIRSPLGVVLTPPITMPVAGAGLGGLVALADGKIAVTGIKSPLNDAYGTSLNWGVFPAQLSSLSGTNSGPNVTSIAHNYGQKFYGLLPCAAAGSVLVDGFETRGDYKVLRFNDSGHISGTYDLGFNDFPNAYALGVNAGETAAYYAKRVTGDTVSKVTLPGLVTTTFVTFATWSVYDNGILVLSNGDVVIGWWKAGAAGSIRRYNSAGVLQQTTTLGVGFAPICLTPGLTDATFWCSYYSAAATFSGVTVTEFTTATGLPTGNSFDPVDGTFQFDGPFCVLRAPIRDFEDTILPDDDPCAIETPLYWVALKPSGDLGDTLQGAQTPLRDPATYYGGKKAPSILSISAIVRAASDYLTGSLPAQSVSVVWADTTRAVRDIFGSVRSDFSSSPLWIFLVSNVTRLLHGTPRLLFYGFLSDDPLRQDLGYTTNANDLVGKDYSLLGDEQLIPKQTIRVDEFPGCPQATLGGGVPIIGGDISNATNGALKLIDVGDVTCQDAIVRRALLVCGHAVKSHVFYQAGAVIPSGDYGRNAWAYGETGWTSIVPADDPYVTLTGKWFTLLFVSGKRALALDPDTAAVPVATVASAASDVIFTLGAGQAAQFTVGDELDIRLAANGNEPELRAIATIVGDVVTITEALSGIPAAADTVRASALAIPDNQDGFVYADVEGMTDTGTPSGVLLEDLILLDRHLLENFLIGDWTAGSWLPAPTFDYSPDGATSYLLDRASWQTASDLSQRYMGGSPSPSFRGAFVIGAHGKRQSTRTVMADLARSANLVRAWRGNNKFAVRMLDRDRAVFLGGRSTLTDRKHILSQPRFAPTPLKDWLTNILTYRYRPNYRDDGTGDYDAVDIRANAPSRGRYGDKPRVETYPYVRDQDTADTVAQQRLDLLSDMPQLWTWGESLCGIRGGPDGQDRGVLDGIAITHYNGKGANGFVDNAMWILKQTHNPKTATLVYAALDVERLMEEP